MSREHGVTDDKLRALGTWQDHDLWSSQERAVLAYAEAMTATPMAVPDELFTTLREHFDAVQIVELTSAIAWEHYRARFNHALEVESAGFSENAYCPLPQPPPGAGEGSRHSATE